MKLNIKGLVFVGFAAAVFASAANAAGEEKTVTSLKYTEATYEKSGNKVEAFTDANKTSTTLYPSNAAVTAALAANGGAVNNSTITIKKNGTSVGTFTVNQATDGDVNIAVPTTVAELTDHADYEVVSNKTQTIAATGSTSNDKYPSETAVRAAITAVEAADDDTTYTFAEGSTDGAFQVTPEGGTAQSVPVHGLAAAAYKGVAASIADGEQGLTTGDQVYDAIQTVAAADDDTTYTFAEGSTDGAFQVTPEGGVAQSVPVHGLAAAAYKPVDTSITAGSTSTNLPTTAAVAAYVDGLIPAAPTTGEGACSAANPCALVSDGATVTWQRIQQ